MPPRTRYAIDVANESRMPPPMLAEVHEGLENYPGRSSWSKKPGCIRSAPRLPVRCYFAGNGVFFEVPISTPRPFGTEIGLLSLVAL